MRMIVQGIMDAQLPWTLVLVGVALAAFCFLVDVPILAVALGIYLPMNLTTGVLAGGIVRHLVERRAKTAGTDEAVDKGVLLASGLVAGGALMGIVVGIFAALETDIAFGLNWFPTIAGSNLLAFFMFVLLALFLYVCSTRKAQSE